MSNNDENERQHKNAHALAGVLQEALEEYLEEQKAQGNALSPIAVVSGVQILAQGWTLFMKHRGASAELMIACSVQAIACSNKLLAYLDETKSNLIPERPEAPEQPQHEGPLWAMSGPVEEC